MISEQLEFQISQYADGTLPAEEVAALEAHLAADADARALLAEYRSLDSSLKRELPLPEIKWERLAEHLSSAVAARDEADRAEPAAPPAPIPLFRRVQPWLAIAASLLLGFGIATLVYRGGNGNGTGGKSEAPAAPAPNQTVAVANAVVEISGPVAATTTQPTVVAISVDASPVAKQVAAADAIVYRPPRVVIASSQVDRQDTQRLPY